MADANANPLQVAARATLSSLLYFSGSELSGAPEALFHFAATAAGTTFQVAHCIVKREISMSKLPPVPPEQRSPKGPGSDPATTKDAPAGSSHDRNLHEQGRQGNIYQNTHNQGYQQDR